MSVSQKFPIPLDDDAANHLKNLNIPSISLPNQEGNYLRLDRIDTLRMIPYKPAVDDILTIEPDLFFFKKGIENFEK